MQITIQPDATGFKPVMIDVNPFPKGTDYALIKAVHAFSETVGLGAFDLVNGSDRNGTDYIKFTLGSGRMFTAFVGGL